MEDGRRGRTPAAVPLRVNAPHRGNARARGERGAGFLRMNRAGTGSALGEGLKGSRNKGAVALSQSASLRASDTRGSERATRIEATRAHAHRSGWRGLRGGTKVRARGRESWDGAVSGAA